MIPAVPKAELHVHLEGTAKPELVRRIAARNGLALPPGLFADDDTFAWRDFLDFLNTYDLAASVIRTAQDYRDIVFEYLSDCAAEGAIYVELISSPDHARSCTVHAGEHAGPESVEQALALPGVTRISHGVRAAEDPELVRRLADTGIVLEVCPTSNVALGVYANYAAHPFAALREAGVAVTLGSDDPPYFGATIGGEYRVAAEHFGLDDAALLDVTRTALTASFADPMLRDRLLERLGSAGPAR